MHYLFAFLLLLFSVSLPAQTTADINWLNAHIAPVRTVNAGNPKDDLHVMKEVAKEAKIVALGECTHGSREIFQIKHRLLEYLVEEMQFTIFAIEGDLAVAGIINDFVLAGKGDSARVVGALDPVWKTQEVWEMIRWMRAYNQTSEHKIQFMGFDMQIPWGVLHHLEGFAKESADSQLAGWLKEISTMQRDVGRGAKNAAAKRNILRLAGQVEKKISAAGASPFIRRNAAALVQLARLQQLRGKAAYNARDEAMAENVASILNAYPGAKIVVWAHNSHVKRTGGLFKTMGYHLSRQFGAAYVPVGFATGEGNFTAGNQAGVLTRNHPLISPVQNSFESWFSQAREKQFLLPLKAAPADQAGGNWLHEKKMFRNIGWRVAVKPEYQFIPEPDLPELFDAIIYLHQTSSAHAYLAKE